MKNNHQSAKKYTNKTDTKSKINITPLLNLTPDQIQEAIQLKAYELYENRGYQPGNEAEDWLNAERIVLKTLNEKSA